MTTKNPRRRAAAHRIAGPGELLQAVPYLLGFRPHESLVLIGLAHGELVVTARLDLADAEASCAVEETIATLSRGGAREIIAAVYDEGAAPCVIAGRITLPWSEVVAFVADVTSTLGCDLVDVLLVAGQRWWSYLCGAPECCPPHGRELPTQPSAFATAATVAGVVALPDRATLAASLDPLPSTERAELIPAIAAAENASVAAVLDARASRHERSVKRAMFAAARASAAPRWAGIPDRGVARFGAALVEGPIRDAVWMAVDDQRLDGRALWRELARRLPSPYDAAPLFLFGWAAWRAGDGALARIAAERVVDTDPGYSPADMLLAALTHGVDPRRMPKLRLPRSA